MFLMTDLDYMKLAAQLAIKGQGWTEPNPMVGAVLVKNKRIIATGWHKRCGGPHAEIEALAAAGSQAASATLYVTLEPCSHFGRTPPCVEAIIQSGIKQVVVGMKDPNPLMNGRSLQKLRRAGIKVRCGLLVEELTRLNEVFIKYIRCQMPFVTAKSAQTIDGKIATADGKSQWITSAAARQYGHRLRDGYSAILVGTNTVLKDNPRLNALRRDKRIKKIILDSRLRISLKAQLFKNVRAQDCFVAVTRQAPQAKVRQFQQWGIHVLICPAKNGRVDLKHLLRELAKREIASVLLEGGAKVIGQALADKLVDKMIVFIAPRIMGDQRALSSVDGPGPTTLDRMVQLQDITINTIGQDLVLEGYVRY